MEEKPVVNIKGITLPVLVVQIYTNDISKIKEELNKKLNEKFFKSGVFLISPADNIEISENTLKEIYMFLENKGLKPLFTFSSQSSSPSSSARSKEKSIEDLKHERVLVWNRNLRAGQKLEYNGDILIIGDVNPGAEVVASGNIIVMGALRGLAWAGSLGDTNSVIVALKMEPQQLRIGNIFASFEGEEERKSPGYPEKAYCVDNEIIIERL
jgi:septum site-determining protein MinC